MKLLLSFFSLLACLERPAAAAVSFCAAGDVMLDRHVRENIEQYDTAYPVEGVKALIQSHDLAFCNVECSISERGSRVRGRWRFRGDPRYVDLLTAAGFNLASVANNHTLDYGREAFQDTVAILRKAGLVTIGGGETQAKAIAPVYVNRKGLTIAFIGNEDVPLDGFTDKPEHAKLPGPAQASIETMEAAVREARKQADLVVVSQHWGIEYADQPQNYQVDWAHRLIDAGASLLLGHHPHVPQPIEFYHGGLIVYSLGNFVFDQFRPRQTRTFVFSCELDKDGVRSPRIVPFRIIDYKFRPLPPSPSDADEILAWMRQISAPYSTQWALSGSAAAYILPPALQFRDQALGGELRVDARGIRWSPPGRPIQHWDLPRGKALRLGVGREDGQVYRLYSVVAPVDEPDQGRLAVFSLSAGKLQGPSFYDQPLNAWKLALKDLDADGEPELCVGLERPGKGDGARRLLVLERWRSSLGLKKLTRDLASLSVDDIFDEPGETHLN